MIVVVVVFLFSFQTDTGTLTRSICQMTRRHDREVLKDTSGDSMSWGVVDNGILIYFVAFAALWIVEVYVHVVIRIYDYIS